MSDSDLPSLPALGAIEIALNRVVGGDRRALERCRALAGAALELRVTDFSVVLRFIAERNGMQVRGAGEDAADVTLTGASGAFARVLFSGARGGLSGGGLRIEGDIGIAQRFAELFSGIDFGVADIVDARLGPVPAYFFSRGISRVRALAARAAHTLPEQAAEYLREETQDAVGAWEHARFVVEVETLRDDVERLAARVRRLDR